MPRASRTLKGNKRRAVFDRLIVPKNGYSLPPQIRELIPDLPTAPVGKRVWIENIIVYEISLSYEGRPKKNVHRIPFAKVVGNPVSQEALDKGYEFTTSQGETILAKWHVSNTTRENQGLILHNQRASGTSWYEPNWGQVYGVGLEWFSCDGEVGGVIWANRHIGNTVTSNEKLTVNLHTSNSEPEYSPYAIRGGLMLGNPEPDRTMWLMGQELPMRVYPALGTIGRGCVFGFNKNVMKYLTVKPPVPPLLQWSGAGTSRADVVGIQWRKDELHEKPTRVAWQVLQGAHMIRATFPSYATDGSLVPISNPTNNFSGSANISSIHFNAGAGDVIIRVMLVECDEQGTPLYILNCNETIWHWTQGSAFCNVSTRPCSGNLPLPVKEDEGCGSSSKPIDPEPPIGGGVTPTGGISYFCDGSIPSSSINTDYWDSSLAPYGVNSPFWVGRNNLLTLFSNSGSTNYAKSVVSINSFHHFLFKFIKDNLDGNGVAIDAVDWQAFRVWIQQEGLSCLTELQKASLYSSYRLGVPVNFFPSASGYLNADILTVLMDMLSLLPRGIYDWIDFNDVVSDSQGSITGAFAVDVPDTNLKAFKSYINFEPQALQYGIDSAVAHRPTDYIKLPGQQWGSETAVDWSSYNLPNMTSSNYQPYVVGEVGVHELGHAVSYFGLDAYGQTLHERADWLNISGWASKNSTHLSKSRPASQTGGMPLTDANKEAPVTDYGCFSPAEDFAEAYRMYIVNPTFLEAKFPQKYAFMVNYVEPMFG